MFFFFRQLHYYFMVVAILFLGSFLKSRQVDYNGFEGHACCYESCSLVSQKSSVSYLRCFTHVKMILAAMLELTL